MRPVRRASLLSYRQVARCDLGIIASLEFGAEQVSRFLGPVDDIIDAVRRGPAHGMTGIECAGELVGFYVIHPDSRDLSCWWIGWFAIDHRRQGHGFGKLALAAIMRRLGTVNGCRRVRLLAAPENEAALGLYRRAGFRTIAVSPETGEFVMECAGSDGVPFDALDALVMAHILSMSGHVRDARLAGLARGARVYSALHGPPAARRDPARSTRSYVGAGQGRLGALRYAVDGPRRSRGCAG